MEMTGEFRIPAPRERVWEALNDPEVLKGCIPGCQTIEKLSDTEFAAKVVASVGPVRATFNGKVLLSDLDPPKGYTISGEGSGGVAGFARGSAKVDLDDDAGMTVLHYAVQAHVGGKLAQIGSRLIEGVSRKMADEFFACFLFQARRASAREAAAGAGADGGRGPGSRRTAGRGSAARPAVAGGLGRRAGRGGGRRSSISSPAANRRTERGGRQPNSLTGTGPGIKIAPNSAAPAAVMARSREGSMQKTVSLTVNGKPVSATVEGRTLLVQLLREQLGLTGTHVGCDTSQCGACVVHVDGEAVKACTLLAVQAEGRSVLTIEGVANGDTLHPMQEAFRNNHALQCGFCTPGMVMSALDLVKNNPNPTEREIREYLEGNLCRCTGYHNIVLAIAEGAAVMRGETPPASAHGAAAE